MLKYKIMNLDLKIAVGKGD